MEEVLNFLYSILIIINLKLTNQVFHTKRIRNKKQGNEYSLLLFLFIFLIGFINKICIIIKIYFLIIQMKKERNYAFIDGQNLHLWTSTEWWNVDLIKLRIYLKDKYRIEKAYYFLWYLKDENNWLYTRLQEAGFIVVFKKQMIEMKSHKKWNIDSDMIFNIMEKLVEEPETFDKLLIISWDWDFKILIDYLIKKQRLLKILFPNKKFASSLYKWLENIYFDYLKNIKSKIEYKKQKKEST